MIDCERMLAVQPPGFKGSGFKHSMEVTHECSTHERRLPQQHPSRTHGWGTARPSSVPCPWIKHECCPRVEITHLNGDHARVLPQPTQGHAMNDQIKQKYNCYGRLLRRCACQPSCRRALLPSERRSGAVGAAGQLICARDGRGAPAEPHQGVLCAQSAACGAAVRPPEGVWRVACACAARTHMHAHC